LVNLPVDRLEARFNKSNSPEELPEDKDKAESVSEAIPTLTDLECDIAKAESVSEAIPTLTERLIETDNAESVSEAIPKLTAADPADCLRSP